MYFAVYPFVAREQFFHVALQLVIYEEKRRLALLGLTVFGKISISLKGIILWREEKENSALMAGRFEKKRILEVGIFIAQL